MAWDDEEKPKPKSGWPVPLKLDDVSVEEMREYIEWLNAEAKRTEAEIAKRGNVRSKAEAFFK